jgi:hypothetical protein
MKTVVIILLILLGIAIWNDPSIIKPWKQAASAASKVVGEGAKKAGELSAEAMK